MARTPDRIAPPRLIADAASALYGQIEASAAIPEEQRHLWINATTKAFNQIMDGVKFEREDNEFIFPSRTRTGVSHRVNGKCTCEASEKGDPCWHRAAKRLVLIMEAPTTPARSTAPAAPVAAAAPAAPVAPPPPPAPRSPGRTPTPQRIRQLITPSGTAQEEVDQLFPSR